MRVRHVEWEPHVGHTAKLRLFQHYRYYGMAGHEWANLTVREVMNDGCVRVERFNGDQPTGELVVIQGLDLERPLFWHPTYEIYAKPDKVDAVVNDWFKRGITVWGNHDLGSPGCGPSAFMPTDNEGSPGWRYTANPVERVSPEDCPYVFRVFKTEWKQDYELIPNIGQLDKRTRRREIARIKREGWKLGRQHSFHGWSAYRDTLVHEPRKVEK